MKHSYVRATLNQETNTIRMISARAMAAAATARRVAMTLLLAVLTTATAWSKEYQSGNWYYEVTSTNPKQCKITKYSDYYVNIESLTIPTALDGYTVVNINTDALKYCLGLKELCFIYDSQIQNMPSLQGRSELTNIYEIEELGYKVSKTLPKFITDIGTSLQGTGIIELTMPGVTSIVDYAFDGCNSLSYLYMHEVTTVSDHAFDGCPNLIALSFGKPASIGVNVFSKLSRVIGVLYSGPLSNWSLAHYQYSPLIIITCSDGSCGWCGDNWNNTPNQDDCLHWKLDADGHLTIECDPTVFANYGPQQVIKTHNWSSIDIKSLSLKNVYCIGDRTFISSPNLTKVNISNGLVIIGSNAFLDCTALKNLLLPSTVTTIGGYAFSGCSGLTTINIPTNVTEIGVHAFENCSSLRSIEIPAGVTCIADKTFDGCSALASVKLPSGLTKISDDAFAVCTSLTSVTIPSGVTEIGGGAFWGCTSLNHIYYEGTTAQWDAITKGDHWNYDVPGPLHLRCTVTFDANGHGSAPAAQTNLWSHEDKATEPAVISAEGYAFTGWYSDAACTTKWNFNDAVPGDMTLYAGWTDNLVATTVSANETTIEIPYGQEWTDIPVTVSSLNLGWFQNEGKPAHRADAVAVTPFVGSGASSASSAFTFYDGQRTIDASKGAGEHTVGNRVSEQLTAVGQSGTLWVHIPKTTWDAATAGSYTQTLPYDAVFLYNGVSPAETYTYTLDGAKVTLNLTVPEAVTLTFDANGGSGDAMAALSTRKGINTTLPASTFTAPTGKAFLCWNTKADGTGTRYYIGRDYSFTENLTLYAEWGEGYTIDLTTATEQDITLGLSGQLTMLNGYFMNDGTMGLDVNLDGVMDVEIAQKEVNEVMTASVKKLTSPTQNYRFVLTFGDEPGEYGSVTFKFVNEGATVEQPAVELLYDNNGTYNREHLLTLKDGQKHHLMLSERTLYRDGYWNTLCLPFAVGSFTGTPLEGATVMELDTETAYDGHKTGLEADGTLYLNFKDATSIEAGKPYIVKWTNTATNIVNPVFHGVTVTAQEKDIPNPEHQYSYDAPEYITVAVPGSVSFTGGKFCGTYDPTDIYDDEHDKFYLGNNNKLYWPETDGYSVKAFRAYFDLSSAPTGVRDFVLNFDEDDATGIISTTNLTNYTNSAGAGWFDLSGRKLQGKPTKKGLYINNGRKVVIK